MSIFQRLFGGSKTEDPNVTSQQAIQRLSSVEEMLMKKQEHLEAQIDTEKANAVRLSRQGNKRAAMLAMKKKKKFEKTLLQIDGTLTTLESQREALQNTSSNMEVFNVMKGAAQALKKANAGVDADAVHDLKDEMDEQLSVADEIANAISAPGFGSSEMYNEADLLNELDELANEVDIEEMTRIGPLPDVPTTAPIPANKTKDKDNSTRELEAWLNS